MHEAVSWVVSILPQLGRTDLYDLYVQAANDEQNGKSTNVDMMSLTVMLCPSDPPETSGARVPNLSYVVNRGRNGWNFNPAVGVCFDQDSAERGQGGHGLPDLARRLRHHPLAVRIVVDPKRLRGRQRRGERQQRAGTAVSLLGRTVRRAGHPCRHPSDRRRLAALLSPLQLLGRPPNQLRSVRLVPGQNWPDVLSATPAPKVIGQAELTLAFEWSGLSAAVPQAPAAARQDLAWPK